MLHFRRGKPGHSLIKKDLSLQCNVLLEKGLHFESFSYFMIFVCEMRCFLKKNRSSLSICLGFYGSPLKTIIVISEKNKKKRGLLIESVSDFWLDFFQNGQDRARKVETVHRNIIKIKN